MRRRSFLALAGATAVASIAVPAAAHHKPGHHHGPTTATTLPATTTTTGESVPTSTFAPGPTTTVLPNTWRHRSGLTWRSGIHTGGFPADVQAFEAWRGRLVDTALNYTDRSSWAALEDPWPLDDAWPGELILAHPMWPTGSGGSFAQVVAGTNDAHYQALGTNLVANNRGDLLISLAWEMNGTWFEWGMGADPSGYAAAYQRIVDQVHVTAPDARFAWVFNGDTPDPTPAYPGDAYVDVIGVDDYDQFPTVDTQGEWDSEIVSVAGLQWTADFAAAHGKPLLVQEWGLSGPADANHGGDNPFFVTKMQDWFRDHANALYAEMYFDATGSTSSGLYDPAENPNSAGTYRAGLHN
jgi:hypothetical protein